MKLLVFASALLLGNALAQQDIFDAIKGSTFSFMNSLRHGSFAPGAAAHERWSASGLYVLRIRPEKDEDFDRAGVRMYRFRKVYDGKEKRFRVDAHPIHGSGWEHSGPMVMIADEHGSHVVYEASPGFKQEVACKKMPMKFEKDRVTQKAEQMELSFESNKLCKRYTHLNIPTQHNTKVEYSELFMDAFLDEPVEMRLEGTTKCHGETYQYFITAFVEEFTFYPETYEVKHMLSWPHDVREICKMGKGELSDDAMQDLEGILMATGF
ncbi:hypothetical protein MP638_002215 [Amoeboaphelidium occidentale]|nr:hypothetical protein MP638_002215 [Amoeboaphelidium occidentale]